MGRRAGGEIGGRRYAFPPYVGCHNRDDKNAIITSYSPVRFDGRGRARAKSGGAKMSDVGLQKTGETGGERRGPGRFRKGQSAVRPWERLASGR